MLLLFRLFVTLSDSVKQAMNLTTSIQTRNNILDWRLEQSHNIGNEFVLALDRYELFQFVSTYEETFLSICSFQCRNTVLLILFQQLCWNIGCLCKHHSCVTLKTVIERREVYFRSLKSLVEKCVLHNDHLNLILEALATQITGLLSVQSGNIYQIEMRIFGQLLSKFYYDSIF